MYELLFIFIGLIVQWAWDSMRNQVKDAEIESLRREVDSLTQYREIVMNSKPTEDGAE